MAAQNAPRFKTSELYGLVRAACTEAKQARQLGQPRNDAWTVNAKDIPALFRAVVDGSDEETQVKEKDAAKRNLSMAYLCDHLAALPPNVPIMYTWSIGRLKMNLVVHKVGKGTKSEPAKIVQFPLEVSWVDDNGNLIVKTGTFGEILWQATPTTLSRWASDGRMELEAHSIGAALERYKDHPTTEDELKIHEALLQCHKYTMKRIKAMYSKLMPVLNRVMSANQQRVVANVLASEPAQDGGQPQALSAPLPSLDIVKETQLEGVGADKAVGDEKEAGEEAAEGGKKSSDGLILGPDEDGKASGKAAGDIGRSHKKDDEDSEGEGQAALKKTGKNVAEEDDGSEDEGQAATKINKKRAASMAVQQEAVAPRPAKQAKQDSTADASAREIKELRQLLKKREAAYVELEQSIDRSRRHVKELTRLWEAEKEAHKVSVRESDAKVHALEAEVLELKAKLLKAKLQVAEARMERRSGSSFQCPGVSPSKALMKSPTRSQPGDLEF